MQRLSDNPRDGVPAAALTERQREVVALVVEGMTNQAIADRLGLTRVTVSQHVATILWRLGLTQPPQDRRLGEPLVLGPRQWRHRRTPRPGPPFLVGRAGSGARPVSEREHGPRGAGGEVAGPYTFSSNASEAPTSMERIDSPSRYDRRTAPPSDAPR